MSIISRVQTCVFNHQNLIHCSAFITWLSEGMNANRNICGLGYGRTQQPHPLFCMPDCLFLQLLLSVTNCMYFISFTACFLCLFIVETLSMYLAWFKFHSFYPVNNKFVSFEMFVVFFYDQGNKYNSLALWIASTEWTNVWLTDRWTDTQTSNVKP